MMLYFGQDMLVRSTYTSQFAGLKMQVLRVTAHCLKLTTHLLEGTKLNLHNHIYLAEKHIEERS